MSNLPSVSDHLPLQVTVSIDMSVSIKHREGQPYKVNNRYPRMDWSGKNMCTRYACHVKYLAASIPNVNIDGIMDCKTARTPVNNVCEAMKDVVHIVVEQAYAERCSPYQGRYRKKH